MRAVQRRQTNAPGVSSTQLLKVSSYCCRFWVFSEQNDGKSLTSSDSESVTWWSTIEMLFILAQKACASPGEGSGQWLIRHCKIYCIVMQLKSERGGDGPPQVSLLGRGRGLSNRMIFRHYIKPHFLNVAMRAAAVIGHPLWAQPASFSDRQRRNLPVLIPSAFGIFVFRRLGRLRKAQSSRTGWKTRRRLSSCCVNLWYCSAGWSGALSGLWGTNRWSPMFSFWLISSFCSYGDVTSVSPWPPALFIFYSVIFVCTYRWKFASNCLLFCHQWLFLTFDVCFFFTEQTQVCA